MTTLDTDALASLKITSRERKLSTHERIAIYAFHLKGVPPKLIARTFGVSTNAIYYITNWPRTAAYQNTKNAYEHLGKERVWAEIVTPAQIESINDGTRKLNEGKFIHDRRRRRYPGSSPRSRRTHAAHGLPETTGDGAHGGGGPD